MPLALRLVPFSNTKVNGSFLLGRGDNFIIALAHSTSSWVIVRPVALVFFGVYAVGTVRDYQRLKRALSEYFGYEITSKNMPALRHPESFDNWKARSPRRERSFLGGFIKVSQPPK